jgi:hypothetical protein
MSLPRYNRQPASRSVSNLEECIRWVLASVLDAGHPVLAFDYQGIGLPRLALRGRFAHMLWTIDPLLAPVQHFAPLYSH